MRKILVLFLFAVFLSACQLTPQPPQPIPGPSEEPANPTNLDLDSSLSPSPSKVQGATTEVSPSVSVAPPTKEKTTQELLNLKPNQKMYVTLKTSLGNMRIRMFPDKAPNTVANFVGLAEGTKAWTDPKNGTSQNGKSLYQGTVFHRIISGFMIQGGDPLGTGTGGPGYRFADEQTGESYTRGTIAMANSGPNTNGSQFFIMHADYPLPPNYTIFGRIDAEDKDSLAILDKIASVPTISNGMGENSKPTQVVTIESVTVERE